MMPSRKVRVFTFGLLVGLALAGAAQLQVRGRHPVAATAPSVSLIGLPAPDFELPLADGCRWRAAEIVPSPLQSAPDVAVSSPVAAQNTLRFADFRAGRSTPGQSAKSGVTLLVFWAFWCDTWKDATQRFQHLRPQFERDGVRVVCVTVDASQQPVARGAFTNGSIWYPVTVDRDSQTAARYGVRRVPTLFVVDAAGIVRARFEAFPNQRRLLEIIREAGTMPADKEF